MIATRIIPEADARDLVQRALDSGSLVAIDTETNGKDIRDGRGYCMGVSLAYHSARGVEAVYLPFRHPNIVGAQNYELRHFLRDLQSILDSRVCVFFNASFDLTSLSTLGLDTSRTKFVCAMIAAHLVNENYPQEKSLNACSRVYLHGDSKKDDERFKKALKAYGWEQMPPELMAEYGAYDAVLTLRLWDVLRFKMKAENQLPVWQHKEKMVRLLNKMERTGVSVDTGLCDKMAAIGEDRMFSIREWELDGISPSKQKDLQKLLIDDFGLPQKYHPKTGQPTFNKEAMDEYEEILADLDDPTARLILEYRGWQKSVSSNYRPYVLLLSPDGRLRPHFLLHGTKTGRLSCREPNLQQIPRSGAKPWNGRMKECFIPEEDYVLLEADFSQLEFRLNAAYARQPALLELFNAEENIDIFKQMSKELGWDRDRTKTFVYSTSYGAGADRISYVFRVDKQGARRHIEHFYDLYPELRIASQRAQATVERFRKIDTWSGRFRHFSSVAREGHKALNSVIQGGAADIVERRMLALDKICSNECRMVLQVHDSVWFEIKREEVERYKPEIQRVMENVEEDFDFGVHFRVEVKEVGGHA